MGIAFAKLFSRLLSKREMRILMVRRAGFLLWGRRGGVVYWGAVLLQSVEPADFFCSGLDEEKFARNTIARRHRKVGARGNVQKRLC